MKTRNLSSTRFALHGVFAILAVILMASSAASDNFADRSFSSAYSLRYVEPNAAATKEPLEPNHAEDPGGHSLWWAWTAPVPGVLTITTVGSGFDTVLALYTGSTLSNLFTLGYIDNHLDDEEISFHTPAGSSYNIAVDGFGGKTGTVVLTITFVPSPANDDFANRAALTGYPLRVVTSNVAATKEPGEPEMIAGYAGGSSLWWSWTPPVHGLLTITTEGTAYDALLSLWTGNVVSNLTSVAQNDARPFETIAVHVEAGIPYAIAIDGYQGRTGETALNLDFVPSPVNDHFADRTVLNGGGISLVASNVAAGLDPGEPAHVGKTGGKSVWWSWTATGTGQAMVSTEGSPFDTLLAVYTGNVLTGLVEVASADVTLGDTVNFTTTAGTTYQIAVDGYQGAEGVFPLRVDQSIPTPLSSASFDSGIEFWSVVSCPDSGPFTDIAGGPWTPVYVPTNGISGGYINRSDPDGNTWFWNAPAKLLGDQSLAYGGSLTFWLSQSDTDSQFPSADVVLSGPSGTMVFAFSNYPGTNWTQYTIPLVASAGWRKDTLEGIVPLEAELKNILSNLTILRIRGEYRTGGDIGGLDEVSWTSSLSDVLFDNENISAVQSGPAAPTQFTLPVSAVMVYLQTYHYFNNGALPGTISLRHEDGSVYGPWQAEGAEGQGGVTNASWIVRERIALKAGTYTIIDSDPATWSQNEGSGHAGFALVRGFYTGTGLIFFDIALSDDGKVVLTWPESMAGYAVQQSRTIDDPAWVDVEESPTRQIGVFTLTVQPAEAKMFYRLNKLP